MWPFQDKKDKQGKKEKEASRGNGSAVKSNGSAIPEVRKQNKVAHESLMETLKNFQQSIGDKTIEK